MIYYHSIRRRALDLLYGTCDVSNALSFNTSVPWVMCKQIDAPDPTINTCNGFYCDELPINQSLIWYKSTFITPEGKGPLSVNLGSMGKGEGWVNGQSIGRYWSTYLSPSTGCTDNCDYRGTYNAQKCQKKCGQPAQIFLMQL